MEEIALLWNNFVPEFSLASGVNVVDGSTLGVLDLTRADGGSEESLLTISVLAVDSAEVRDAPLLQTGVVLASLGITAELVGDLVGLDLPVDVEGVESRLSNGDDLLDDVPKNALGEGRSGQTTLVGPSSVGVEVLDEGRHVELRCVTTVVGNQSGEPLVMVIGVSGEVLVRDHLEDEAEHPVGELGAFLLGHGVDDVHLKVVDLAIDGVLSGSMEVGLHAREVDVLVAQVVVEEAGGLGGEAR